VVISHKNGGRILDEKLKKIHTYNHKPPRPPSRQIQKVQSKFVPFTAHFSIYSEFLHPTCG